MSTYETAPMPTEQPEPDKPKRSLGRRFLKIGAYSVGALMVFGVGVAAGGGPPEQVETVKEVEVEVEVPGETVTEEVEVEVEVPGPEKTVEVEVPGDDVEVTPAVCIEAIDQASSMFGAIGPIFSDTIAGMFNAIDAGDPVALQKHADDLGTFSDGFGAEADEYNRLKAECAQFPMAD